MSSLPSIIAIKCAYETGWENAEDLANGALAISSARHGVSAIVTPEPGGWRIQILGSAIVGATLADEGLEDIATGILAKDEITLTCILRRIAELAHTLPADIPEAAYQESLETALADIPAGTEAERLVRQRVGQDLYRKTLLAYWQGACAVTRLAVPALLRASHAKPWADCATDAERLDVFNGFLLAPAHDAAFDAGLITFTLDGSLQLSPNFDPVDAAHLGISATQYIRHLSPAHAPYIEWHRQHVFQAKAGRPPR